MTRREILKKYGFRYMSSVNLDEKITEEEAAEFESLIKELKDHRRNEDKMVVWPEWKERLYRRFVGVRR